MNNQLPHPAVAGGEFHREALRCFYVYFVLGANQPRTLSVSAWRQPHTQSIHKKNLPASALVSPGPVGTSRKGPDSHTAFDDRAAQSSLEATGAAPQRCRRGQHNDRRHRGQPPRRRGLLGAEWSHAHQPHGNL